MSLTLNPVSNEVRWRGWVVAEARSWIGTPYALNRMVKGAGVDCARIIYQVYKECNLMPDQEIDRFKYDFGCHTNDEQYVFRMLRHATKVLETVAFPNTQAKPGDACLMRNDGSRVYNHGGIVTAWPKVIHAAPDKVAEIDVTSHWLWAGKVIQIFDPWEKMRDSR